MYEESTSAQHIVAHKANLIFDFDDTLVASYRVRSRTLIRTAKIFGVLLGEDRIRSLWGRPFPDLIAGLLPTVPFDEFLETYREEMRKDQPAGLPGAEDLLHYCRATSKRVIVHSSSRTDLIRQDIDHLGWTNLIDKIYGIDRTIYSKPDPRSLRAPLLYLGEREDAVQSTLYIGDSPTDAALAKACGVPFLCVLSGLVVERCQYEDGTVFVESLSQLVEKD